jgi:ligand-binding sensor domain-containing protein
MKHLFASALVIAMLCSATVASALDGWNVYLDASALHGITVTGDSLWCSTSGGVLLFDLTDSTFTQYYDGLEFPSSEVRAIARSGDGSIWIGFEKSGIVRVENIESDPISTRYDEVRSGILSDSISCFLRIGDELLYGCADGVAKFRDGEHMIEPVLTDSLGDRRVNFILREADTLWIACEDGVALFDRSSADYEFYALGSVTSLCLHEGSIHAAGNSGTSRFEGGAWVAYGTLPLAPVSIASGAGELYCITPVSPYRWNGTFWQGIDGTGFKTLHLNLYRVGWDTHLLRALAADGNGTPWVGGVLPDANRGVYLTGYVQDSWTNKAPELLSQSRIVELALGERGGIWASTNQYGISHLSSTGEWTIYTRWRNDWGDEALSYTGNNLALLYDSRGYLWCNALDYDLDRIAINDISNIEDDEWAHYELVVDTITSNRFVKAKEDPAGNRWFMSDDNAQTGEILWGINIRGEEPEDGWMHVDPLIEPDMMGGSIVDCAYGTSGIAYLAIPGFGVQAWSTGGFTWSSLKDLNDDSWTTLIGPDDLTTTKLYSIARSEDGILWVGTSGGLVRYRAGVIDSIPKKNNFDDEGLIGSIVYDIEYDGSGNLWVATDGGLNMIDTDGVIAAYTSYEYWTDALQLIYPSSVVSPLPHNNCSSLQYDGDEDILWVGTLNGLVRIDVAPPPAQVLPLSDLVLYPNPVHISRGDSELRIGRVTGLVSIRVYTIEGELVHEASDVGDGDAAWDLLTLNGFKARSGIYIVRIERDGISEVRKVALIR